MQEMIGHCGYNCHLCAARSDDIELRQRLVDGWRRVFGHQQYTAEARPCARARGVESCAQCDKFPCDKMRHLMASREGLLIFCRPKDGPVTSEDYDLCMRQFDSMPNLVRRLAEVGKLGSWAVRKPKGNDE